MTGKKPSGNEWYRKVPHPMDATLYEGKKHLDRALAKVSTRHWIVEVVPHTRSGGVSGSLIRISRKNPVKPGRWYIAEVTRRPKAPEPTFDD